MGTTGERRTARRSPAGGTGGRIDPLRGPAGAFFRAAFHSTVVGVVVNDARGRIVRVNATFARMLGYRVGELRGRHSTEITHPDDVEESRRQIEALRAGRIRRIRIEKRYRHRDGRTLWARTHVALVKEPGRPAEYAVAMVEDISARREAVVELQTSREFATGVFQHVGEAMTVLDAKTQTILVANRAFLRMVGRTGGDVIGKTFREVIHAGGHPFDPTHDPCPLEQTLLTGRPARSESRFRRPGGRPLDVEVATYPIRDERGRVGRVIHIHRDITERKRAETLQSVLFEISEATGAAESLDALYGVIHRELDRLIDARNFYVALYDEETGTYSFPFVEDEYDEEVDYTPQELRKSLTDYVRRTGRAVRIDEALHRRLQAAGELKVLGEPSKIWLGAPLRTGRGVIGVVAVQSYRDPDRYTERDVELLSFVSEQIALAIERKRAEDDLRRSKDFVENVFRNVSDGICVIDPRTYGIVGANRAFLKAAGVRGRDAIGRTCYSVTHGRSEPCGDGGDLCPMEETLRTGRPCRREHEHVGASGRRAWTEVRTSAMRNNEGKIDRIMHVSRDITERKRAELLQAVLFRISEATGSAGGLEALFRVIHEQLGRLINTRNFYIALYDEESALYSFPYCVDEREKILGMGSHGMERSLTDLVRRTGRAMLVDRDELRRLEREGVATSIGTPSAVWLGAPLRVDGRVIGVVSTQSYDDPERYTQGDLDLLTFVSDHVALAIDRKRKDDAMRESEERYRDLFENASDLIQIVGTDARILYVNRAWLATLGYAGEEIREMSIFDVVHPDSRDHCREVFARSMRGESVDQVESILLCRDGRAIEVEGNIGCRRRDGRVVSACGIFRDVTERKRVDRMKDEFISTVNHELRTPLTSIHGAIEIVRGGRAGALPDGAKALLEIAGRNSNRLRKLIDDLLDIQKIESGGVQFESRPLDLSAVVRRSIENNEAFAAQFKVEFVLKDGLPDLQVEGDDVRLTQVMDNLLSNAAKFSPPESRVEVRVTRRDGCARVDVRDHGPGIPEEFRDQVFRKFTQAHSSMTRERGGTGLGLSIAKSIVERMGGTIDFETRLNEGTTFYFELPEYRGPAGPGD